MFQYDILLFFMDIKSKHTDHKQCLKQSPGFQHLAIFLYTAPYKLFNSLEPNHVSQCQLHLFLKFPKPS